MNINDFLLEQGINKEEIIDDKGNVTQEAEFTEVNYQLLFDKINESISEIDENGPNCWSVTSPNINLRHDYDNNSNWQLIKDAILWTVGDNGALTQAKNDKIEELKIDWRKQEKIPYPTSFGFSVLVAEEDLNRWTQLGSSILVNHQAYESTSDFYIDSFYVKDSDGEWHLLSDPDVLIFLDEIGFYWKEQVYGRFTVKESMVNNATTIEEVEAITY